MVKVSRSLATCRRRISSFSASSRQSAAWIDERRKRSGCAGGYAQLVLANKHQQTLFFLPVEKLVIFVFIGIVGMIDFGTHIDMSMSLCVDTASIAFLAPSANVWTSSARTRMLLALEENGGICFNHTVFPNKQRFQTKTPIQKGTTDSVLFPIPLGYYSMVF